MVYTAATPINLACAVTDPIPAEIRPTPLDLHLGKRIRARRNAIGMPLEELAQAMAVATETLLAIENGCHRVGPQLLHRLSVVLDVPFGYFFDGMPRELDADFPGTPFDDCDPVGDDMREALELVRAYLSITDEKKRQMVHHLAQKLSENPSAE